MDGKAQASCSATSPPADSTVGADPASMLAGQKLAAGALLLCAAEVHLKLLILHLANLSLTDS